MTEFEYRNPDVDLIIKEASRYFQIRPALVMGKVRKTEFVKCRFTCYYLIKKFLPDLTLKRIGFHFENTDYSSVIHGLTNVELWIEKDENYTGLLYELTQKVKAVLKSPLYIPKVDDEFEEEESYESPDENTFKFLNHL